MTSKPLSLANIHWIDEQHAINKEADDRYFSDDAVAESDSIYLQGNQLASRWQHSYGDVFTIVELGYGTGLNFLLTQQLWDETHRSNLNNYQQLNYISIERSPLKRQDLQKFYRGWPQLLKYSRPLLKLLPMPTPGCHLIHFPAKASSSIVDLFIYYMQAQQALTDLIGSTNNPLDAIYLDGFSPAKNSSLWTLKLFQQLAMLSNDQTTASSFCAASAVKKNLETVGFEVQTKSGFGKKREMIVARFNPGKIRQTSVPTQQQQSQPCRFRTTSSKPEILVIGAGLAGIITASKLSSRGYQVDVVEANEAPCEQASGNAFGLAYPRLSNKFDSSCQLHCCAFDYLNAEIQQLNIPTGTPNAVSARGIIYLLQRNPTRMHAETARHLNIPQTDIRYLDPQQTSAILATEVNSDALLFSQGCALSPKQMAQAYLASPGDHDNNLRFYFKTTVKQLDRKNNAWQIKMHQGETRHYQQVFICCGHQLQQLLPQFSDYTQSIKGQIDQLGYPRPLPRLPLCGNGYVIPCQPTPGQQKPGLNTLWAGASFHRIRLPENCGDQLSSQEDTHQNIKRARLLLQATEDEFHHLKSRASIRLASSDRLPLAGQWYSGTTGFSEDGFLTGLSENKNDSAGLFINTAFGSHGLTLIPLVSEYIVRLFNGEPLPLSQSLAKALDPLRFAKRSARYQKRK